MWHNREVENELFLLSTLIVSSFNTHENLLGKQDKLLQLAHDYLSSSTLAYYKGNTVENPEVEVMKIFSWRSSWNCIPVSMIWSQRIFKRMSSLTVQHNTFISKTGRPKPERSIRIFKFLQLIHGWQGLLRSAGSILTSLPNEFDMDVVPICPYFCKMGHLKHKQGVTCRESEARGFVHIMRFYGQNWYCKQNHFINASKVNSEGKNVKLLLNIK